MIRAPFRTAWVKTGLPAKRPYCPNCRTLNHDDQAVQPKLRLRGGVAVCPNCDMVFVAENKSGHKVRFVEDPEMSAERAERVTITRRARDAP